MLPILPVFISPCPNDTFLFFPLITGLIKARSFQPEFHYLDIAELNALGQQRKPALIKMSFANYYLLGQDYRLLNSGSALGHGCGPLLIAREPVSRSRYKDLRVQFPD